MSETPGDPKVTKLFGFPGFEALMRVGLKYINQARDAHNQPAISYEDFRAEIEAKVVDITNGTP